jgi:hypothetical protein
MRIHEILTEADTIRFGREYARRLKNRQHLLTLLASKPALRGWTTADGDVWVWDAYALTHNFVERKLPTSGLVPIYFWRHDAPEDSFEQTGGRDAASDLGDFIFDVWGMGSKQDAIARALQSPTLHRIIGSGILGECGGVGRVVRGVNTTVDVGPDEISRQAAKWGFDVDKDGIPPSIWTTVSKTKRNKKRSKVRETVLAPASIPIKGRRASHTPITHLLDRPIVARIQLSVEVLGGVAPYDEFLYTGESVDEVVQNFTLDLPIIHQDYEQRSLEDHSLESASKPFYDGLTQLFVNGSLIPRSHSWSRQLNNKFRNVTL